MSENPKTHNKRAKAHPIPIETVRKSKNPIEYWKSFRILNTPDCTQIMRGMIKVAGGQSNASLITGKSRRQIRRYLSGTEVPVSVIFLLATACGQSLSYIPKKKNKTQDK